MKKIYQAKKVTSIIRGGGGEVSTIKYFEDHSEAWEFVKSGLSTPIIDSIEVWEKGELAKQEKIDIRTQALAKLTPEEQEALGLRLKELRTKASAYAMMPAMPFPLPDELKSSYDKEPPAAETVAKAQKEESDRISAMRDKITRVIMADSLIPEGALVGRVIRLIDKIVFALTERH